MHAKSTQSILAVYSSMGIVLLSALCYGSITTFATVSYDAGLTVEHLVISRGFTVAVICFTIAIVFRFPLSFDGIKAPQLIAISLAFVTTSFLQLGAVQYITVGLTAVLFFTFPMFVILYNILAGHQKADAKLLCLPLIALIGISLTIGIDISGLDWRGVSMAMIAAMAMAASILSAQRYLNNTSILGLACASNLTASILALALWILSGNAHFPKLSDSQIFIGVGTAVAVGALFAAGLLLQFLGLRRIGSGPTSMALNFEPIVTLVIAALLIGEVMTWNKTLGASLIILAVFLSSPKQGKTYGTAAAE